jgi:Ca2+-binding RTX toxin-like protein
MPVTQPAGAITTLASGTFVDAKFSSDGSQLFGASGNAITVFDVSTGVAAAHYYFSSAVGAMDLSADGKYLAFVLAQDSGSTGVFYRMDLSSGSLAGYVISGAGAFNDIAFLSDDSVVLSQQNSAPLLEFNPAAGSSHSVTATVPGGAVLTESDNSTYLIAQAHVAPWPLYSFDSTTNTSQMIYTGNTAAGTPADSAVGGVSPNGNFVVQGVSLRVYDKALNFVTDLGATFPYLKDAAGLAFSHDGASLYVATRDGQIVKFSTSSWDAVAAYPIGAVPANPDAGIGYGDILRLSPDGHHLSVITTSGIQLVDVSQAVPVATAGADALDGSGSLYGLGGNDVLTGSGSSFLYGGTGNDTYVLTHSGDVVGEYANQGTDLVQSAFSYQLGANLENLTLTGTSAISGTGNALDNVIAGNGAANGIDGGAGSDTLTGGAGADTLTGGAGNDIFKDTASGLNGDTITDMSIGDKIVITDANLAGFSFSLSGHTLTYTGGSLTLGSVPSGHIVASAAAGGGVELSFGQAAPNDFNGDGLSDVLWRNDGGLFTDWLGRSDGSFTGNSDQFLIRVDPSWHVADSGDFNGDGRVDLLWINDGGLVTDWLGQHDGGFLGNSDAFLTQVSTGMHVAGTADFNGDGLTDILWKDDNGTVVDWLAQANGSFLANPNSQTHVDASWHILAAGDFNGDGLGDVLWRNDGGLFTDWLGQRDGSFAGNSDQFLIRVDPSWHVAESGDFNGDGRTDLLWINDGGLVTDWLGQHDGGFVGNSDAFLTRVSTSMHVAATGDFNGDGLTDILWKDDNGTVVDWFAQANGSFLVNSNSETHVDASWHVQPPETLF